MELFGVQVLPNTSKSNIAPGWAYVADSGPASSLTTAPSNSRKRAARNITGASGHGDFTAKQDAKILRDLAALDKEGGIAGVGGGGANIPVPVRARDGAGRVSHGKVTPGVRKILQSQKTFANHLSDYEAFAAQALSNPSASTPHPNQYTNPHPHPNQYTTPAKASPSTTPGSSTPATGSSKDKSLVGSHLTSTGKRSHKKKDPSQLLRKPSGLAQVSTPPAKAAVVEPVKAEPKDTPMPDAPLSPLLKPLPANLELKTHPMDNDPLLKSRIPNVPDEEVLRKLVQGNSLSYAEARGTFETGPAGDAEFARAKGRVFCEICGYWGRVKCLRCGGRVCALECLRVHGEECYARYGA